MRAHDVHALQPVAFRTHFGYSNGMEPSANLWLELASGEQVPIAGTCSIGRAPSNQLVLPDEKVSRHHALIQTMENHECWIVDLASANGTYVNGRRIEQALLLRERDEITIGPARIIFRASDAPSIRHDDDASLERTVHDVRQLTAWFFLADVIDSTGISRRLGPHAMPKMFDDWLARCREVLEGRGGIIDKPLGDGFFAFWPTEWAPEHVADAVMAFRKLQGAAGGLPFRMVLHRGAAFTGGQMASGTYRLFGPEVTYTFRMEGLAKTLKIDCLLSEAAMGALGHLVATTPAGSHRVPGLDGSFSFFRL
jgi:adenylate cyclase